MGGKFLSKIMHLTSDELNSSMCSQIHIVFDKYKKNSIKASTREKRGDTNCDTSAFLQHVVPNVALPMNWNHFLACGQNKSGLARCYTSYIESHVEKYVEDGKKFFISGGKEDTIISITNRVDILGNCDQEEADSRLVLHSILAAEAGAKTIVVNSPDTDVLMLLLHHRPRIHVEQLYLYAGKRFIPVHSVYAVLSAPQENIILEVYCLTGCDTTSFFYFQGKKKSFTLMQQMADHYPKFGHLG